MHASPEWLNARTGYGEEGEKGGIKTIRPPNRTFFMSVPEGE